MLWAQEGPSPYGVLVAIKSRTPVLRAIQAKAKQRLQRTCESHNDLVVAALSEWTCVTGLVSNAGELNYHYELVLLQHVND